MPGKWCGMAISSQVRELKSDAGTYPESIAVDNAKEVLFDVEQRINC
jgi:hypothetical protein